MLNVNGLKNLNGLGVGLHKKWIFSSRLEYDLCCDYLQKLNYSIQDFNTEINSKDELSVKTVTYLILLTTWIVESCEQIQKTIRNSVKGSFYYKSENELQNAKAYLRAIRSFVVAHPLTTDRHSKFWLDGNYSCVDIKIGMSAVQRMVQQSLYIFSMDGVRVEPMEDCCDYYLLVYSEKDGAQFFQYFGCNICDLMKTASLYIDKIYALDKYLNKLTKKDFAETYI